MSSEFKQSSSSGFSEGTNSNDLVHTDGNVGIGTSNPATLFHLEYTSNDVYAASQTGSNAYSPKDKDLFIKNNATGTDGTYARLFLIPGSGSTGYGINTASVTAVRIGDFNTALAFSTRGTAGGLKEAIRITHEGKVGIGTTGPTAELDVNGKAKSDETVDSDASTTLVTKGYMEKGAGNQSKYGGVTTVLQTRNPTTDQGTTGKYWHFKFPLNANTGGDNRMFHFTVTGYRYSPAEHFVAVFSGYCYANGNSLLNHAESGYDSGSVAGLTTYKNTTDGYVYGRIEFTSIHPWYTEHYSSVRVEHMRVGNGIALDYNTVTFVASPFPDLSVEGTYTNGDRTAIITATADTGLLKTGNDDPTKLLNGLRATDTKFSSNPSAGLGFNFEFDTPQTVTSFALTAHNVVGLGSVNLLGSTDGSTWVSLGTPVTLDTSTEIQVPSPAEFKHFRIEFVGNTSSTFTWLYQMLFITA